MRDLVADALLDNSEEAFCILDSEGRFVYASVGAERLLRRPREEILGRKAWEEFQQGVGGNIQRAHQLALEEHEPLACELYYPPMDSWFEVRGYPRGELLVVQFRDVTERKKAQAALRESEERFQLVAQATGDVLWDHDFHADRLWWSEHFSELLGYPSEQVGDTFASWEERVHPEDRARVSAHAEGALRARRPTSSVEYRFRRADGVYLHVLDRMHFLYDEAGEPRRGIGVLVDITEQKAAEARQRFLYEAGLVLTSTLDYEQRLRDLARVCAGYLADCCVVDVFEEDGRIRRIEAAASDPEKEPLVRELLRFPPVLAREEGVTRALKTGEPVLVEHLTERALQRMTQSDEHLKALQALAPKSYMVVPLQARGETVGAFKLINTTPGRHFAPADVALAKDLARQAALDLSNARLHREMDRARHAAEEASHAKGQFLAMMSHELRTPLTAIVTYADLIDSGLSGPVSAKQKEHAARIMACAWHQVAMIEEVLTYSRMEAGAEQVRLEPVDAAEVARGVVHLLVPEAEAKGVALHRCLPEHRIEIETDAGRLRQILMNLLGNAIKFTDRGEVVIRMEQSHGRVEFRVSDTGGGIAPENHERIFEPFVQAEDAHTRRHHGTGLGLAISRRFARMLGGDIEVESSPGQGSTFTLRLPAPARS